MFSEDDSEGEIENMDSEEDSKNSKPTRFEDKLFSGDTKHKRRSRFSQKREKPKFFERDSNEDMNTEEENFGVEENDVSSGEELLIQEQKKDIRRKKRKKKRRIIEIESEEEDLEEEEGEDDEEEGTEIKEQEEEDQEEVEEEEGEDEFIEKRRPKKLKKIRKAKRTKRKRKKIRKRKRKRTNEEDEEDEEDDIPNGLLFKTIDTEDFVKKNKKPKKKKKKGKKLETTNGETENAPNFEEEEIEVKTYANRKNGIYVENFRDEKFKHFKKIEDVLKEKKEVKQDKTVSDNEKLIEHYENFPKYVEKIFHVFYYFISGILGGISIMFLLDSYLPFTTLTVDRWMNYYFYRWFVMQPLFQIFITMMLIINWYLLVTTFKKSSNFVKLILIFDFIVGIGLFILSITTNPTGDYVSLGDFSSETDKYFFFYLYQITNGLRSILLFIVVVKETVKKFTETKIDTNMEKEMLD